MYTNRLLNNRLYRVVGAQKSQFFQMLPTDFTKQEAVKQAKVLGVALSTMERWIDKFVQSTDIVRVTHGQYQNRNCKIA